MNLYPLFLGSGNSAVAGQGSFILAIKAAFTTTEKVTKKYELNGKAIGEEINFTANFISNLRTYTGSISGFIVEGLPYYAIWMQLINDSVTLNMSLLSEEYKIATITQEINIQQPNVIFTFEALPGSVELNCILEEKDFTSTISIGENRIIEITNNVIELNENNVTFNTQAGNIYSDILEETIYPTNINAEILNNNITILGYVNGEFVSINTNIDKNYVIEIKEGWNNIIVPTPIANNKEMKVFDFINILSNYIDKEPYEVFEIASFVENDTENNFIITKEFMSDVNGPNNFNLFKQVGNEMYPVPFLIKSLVDATIPLKEIL